jgi:hypothetical protein
MATDDSGSSTRKKTSGSKKATKSGESGSRSTKKASTAKRSAPRAESRPTPGASEVATSAARELLELTGKQPEGITGLERTDDGWTVQVEVVEVRRIPDTTDVLALYEVSTDERGQMQGYRRVQRYARGVPGKE